MPGFVAPRRQAGLGEGFEGGDAVGILARERGKLQLEHRLRFRFGDHPGLAHAAASAYSPYPWSSSSSASSGPPVATILPLAITWTTSGFMWSSSR